MVSSNKASFKPGVQRVMQVLTCMSIALLGIGLLLAIWLNIKMARQLEEVIRGFNAQQQVVRSSEKQAEDAYQQTSEELAKAEASLNKMNEGLNALASRIMEEQGVDRQKFRDEIDRLRKEANSYNNLLSNLSTKLGELSESSDLNPSSNQKAGGSQ
jgi:biopolymer transport protein ExbB/TolQ